MDIRFCFFQVSSSTFVTFLSSSRTLILVIPALCVSNSLNVKIPETIQMLEKTNIYQKYFSCWHPHTSFAFYFFSFSFFFLFMLIIIWLWKDVGSSLGEGFCEKVGLVLCCVPSGVGLGFSPSLAVRSLTNGDVLLHFLLGWVIIGWGWGEEENVLFWVFF